MTGPVTCVRNLLESAFLNGPGRKLSTTDIPEWFLQSLQSGSKNPSEKDRVLAALAAANWNKSRAAQALQWSRMTLYRKLAKYQIVTTR
ncbi:MAG: helix-turn-helix domain-containing protein [Bryobacteraceae bacterium]